jgi:hypothetical protein
MPEEPDGVASTLLVANRIDQAPGGYLTDLDQPSSRPDLPTEQLEVLSFKGSLGHKLGWH